MVAERARSDSRNSWNRFLQCADLDGNGNEELGGGAAALAALWRTALPAGAAVSELCLHVCAIRRSSFSGCGLLVAGVPVLYARCCLERTAGTDAALRSALDALIALAPNLGRLEISNDCILDEPGWALTAGLPPAVLSLRHLARLSLEGSLLPSLPDGPYFAGEPVTATFWLAAVTASLLWCTRGTFYRCSWPTCSPALQG